MATEYAWVVSAMDTKPQDGELNDVVATVHWRRGASLTEGDKTYTAETYGAMGCASPSETDFTAYADLTFEDVCGWLEASIDVEAENAKLDAKIQSLITPPIVNLALPWQSAE
jgi:hypothetical protein